jgi:hypothetical protein
VYTRLHTRSSPKARYWGVFTKRVSQDGNVGRLVNQAWDIAVKTKWKPLRTTEAKKNKSAKDIYIVDMGEPIGHVEHRENGKFSHSSKPTSLMKIEVKAGTNELDSAYPHAPPHDVATAFTGPGYPRLRLTEGQWGHVAAHERLADDKDINAIFAGDSQELVQEAWQRIQHHKIRPVEFTRKTTNGQQEKLKAYRVDMGRIIGHDQVRDQNGTIAEYPHDHLRLIMTSDDNLITAYPTDHLLNQGILDNRVSE